MTDKNNEENEKTEEELLEEMIAEEEAAKSETSEEETESEDRSSDPEPPEDEVTEESEGTVITKDDGKIRSDAISSQVISADLVPGGPISANLVTGGMITASAPAFGWQQPPSKPYPGTMHCAHIGTVAAKQQLRFQAIGDTWVCTCGDEFEIVLNTAGKKILKAK